MALFATRRTLGSLLSRAIHSPSRLRLSQHLLNLQYQQQQPSPNPFNAPTRSKTTGSGYSPLNDPSPNFSNRPPKETILLDGCDYEHWLVVLEFPNDPKPSDDEMINAYVKTLTAVVGSEEEAMKKIYSVCTTTYTGFGALISEEESYKVKAQPGVLWVLPDSYLDVPNKDYGGDLFIDGKVIPRPQYRFDDRQNQPNSRNRPRPRYDRRRDQMQVQRREPSRTGNEPTWSPNNQAQTPSVHQPLSSENGHNVSQFGNGYQANQSGGFQGNNSR